MPAGLGGGGAVGLALETVMGTYVAPTVWCPILSEGLRYTSDNYYSPQLRQQTIVSDVKLSYYHTEGDIRMEVDPNFIPYWLFASRHTPSFASGVYSFVPSSAGAASTAASGMVPRTLSITIIRNGVTFGYAGCVVNTWEFTVDNGVLIANMGVLGLSEATQTPGTPAWVDPVLYGADAHQVFLDASGTSPTFATVNVDFNGFTANLNYNATPQNRIRSDRSASYIAYGETEATITSELDFLDKTIYDARKAGSTQAIKFHSLNGGNTFALATNAFELVFRRVAYDMYEVGLGGMGDLIMANFTGRDIGIAGAAAYTIRAKSPVVIS